MDTMEAQGVERVEVYYSGCVQGVGFRYTVRSLASRFNVTGFVRNLVDGRVELVAEGTPDELRRFLQAIQQAMRGHIRKAEESRRPATGEFEEFTIRF